MGARKQKGRPIKRRASDRILLFLSAIILGSALIFGSVRRMSYSVCYVPPPLFEETYSVPSKLSTEIRKIDNGIYGALYERDIPQNYVNFSTVKPRHKEGNYWDFTDLLLSVPNMNDIFAVEKTINDALCELKETVSFKKEHVERNEVIWHIFALGFYTHRVRLIHVSVQPGGDEALPRISIIIDDLGYNRDLAFSFIRFSAPLGISVLPSAPYTQEIAHEANRWSKDLILHLPMEPRDYPHLHPGPGALLMNMSEKEIRLMINNDLNGVLGVRGVNNHMGSRFTEKRDKMSIVFEELSRRDLFYIDSRTGARTVALTLAKEMGVPAASRSVFLDNELSPAAIRFQIQRLLGIARHSGRAIGIGHPHRATLEVLNEYLNRFSTEVEVVPVSELVN